MVALKENPCPERALAPTKRQTAAPRQTKSLCWWHRDAVGAFQHRQASTQGITTGAVVTTGGLLLLLWLAKLVYSMQAKEQILWNWIITSTGNLHSSLLLPSKANIQVSLFVLFLQHEVTNLLIWGLLPLILFSPVLLGSISPVNLTVFDSSTVLKQWEGSSTPGHTFKPPFGHLCFSTLKKYSSRSC